MIPSSKPIFSVNDINKYVKSVLTNDSSLKYIYIKGEISNAKVAMNGHLYLSLKDDDSLINGVMFSNYLKTLPFKPKDGDEVIVLASIDVYVPRGTYQLCIYDMNLNGLGNILIELEKLKKQLASEGLFDESRKRSINIYPNKIGVITANNSAALKDIVYNINRRYPICEIYFFPANVQGDNAPTSLLKAFLKSQEYDLDTLIIGRGGGASEDLGAFNDEKLVRAIATSKMPVIAAVGHEIDSTLVDYVADKRASTPTAAAELATVDQREIKQSLSIYAEKITTSLNDQLETMKEDIDNSIELLNDSIQNKIEELNTKLTINKQRILSLNPQAVLSRGYSISVNKNGKVISSIEDVEINEEICTTVKDGKITSVIKEKNNG